jgi:hypothetical protein
MQNDLRILLPQLLPRATSWAETVAAEVATSGTPLSDDGLSVASSVEVSHPSRVRILMVDRFPKPSDPELQTAASQAGLLGPTTTGLTLGYSVLIRNGHMSRRLLSHECRHVYQFEQAGSIAAFLQLYFKSIIQFGNWDSPIERDARAHELKEISTDA